MSKYGQIKEIVRRTNEQIEEKKKNLQADLEKPVEFDEQVQMGMQLNHAIQALVMDAYNSIDLIIGQS